MLFSVSVMAEPSPYDDCIEKEGGYRNGSVEACSHVAKEFYDREIEEKLLLLKSKMSDEKYQLLLKSQETWLKYVQDICRVETELVGDLNYIFCPMNESEERLRVLTRYINQ
jgi:uncharacterized protein YecT (DUF1311 family)